MEKSFFVWQRTKKLFFKKILVANFGCPHRRVWWTVWWSCLWDQIHLIQRCLQQLEISLLVVVPQFEEACYDDTEKSLVVSSLMVTCSWMSRAIYLVFWVFIVVMVRVAPEQSVTLERCRLVWDRAKQRMNPSFLWTTRTSRSCWLGSWLTSAISVGFQSTSAAVAANTGVAMVTSASLMDTEVDMTDGLESSTKAKQVISSARLRAGIQRRSRVLQCN